MSNKAILVLEDGTAFKGEAVGRKGEVIAEVVFNTSMTGYQEIMTDPSYTGQMVVMTYPLIGNYGVNEEDVESSRPHIEAFIMRELCDAPSNYRSQKSLLDYMNENKVMGIQNIDTRALTRHIRLQGAMMGILSTEELNPKSLHQKVAQVGGMIGKDLASVVSTKKSYYFSKQGKYFVKVIDFGVKTNILRCLKDQDCRIEVIPADSTIDDILKDQPNGIFLSNGPGDPAAVTQAIETVKGLMGKMPIFGICLGHQILGLAMGGKTIKLKFGHRGANHPVLDKKSGKVAITSQNHSFALVEKSLAQEEVEVTHINLNDQTVEGLRHKKYPIFSVQYHPEASPGPHDAYYLFEQFIESMKNAHKVETSI